MTEFQSHKRRAAGQGLSATPPQPGLAAPVAPPAEGAAPPLRAAPARATPPAEPAPGAALARSAAAKAGTAAPVRPARVLPTVARARPRTRHHIMAIAFAAVFVLPVVLTALYLWIVARDQYASTVAFTVQREEAQSPVDILGGLTSLSGSTSSDSDILFEYIQSQEVVAAVDRRFDLRTLYARGYWTDPVFHLAPGATIEELLAYWRRMVHISYAPGTGLISVEVKAFAPEEAQAIAQMIFDESSAMINRLSAIARDDAIRYARDDLDAAVAQLKTARQAMTTFRSRTQIVDPGADIQAQMGLLSTLQQQLGAELINYDLLRQTTRADDPRVTQSDQRITAIRERIRQERAKFGAGGAIDGDGEDYAGLIAEYETLSVDLEFAQQKYGAALTNFDSALASAQRQSRYLAAYVSPTLAESAEYPRRLLLLGVVALILLGSWAVGVLVFYSLRDRR